MKCKLTDCDGVHCKRCGGHVIDVSGDVCAKCQVRAAERAAERMYGATRSGPIAQ
jgi:ribosomal protein L37E